MPIYCIKLASHVIFPINKQYCILENYLIGVLPEKFIAVRTEYPGITCTLKFTHSTWFCGQKLVIGFEHCKFSNWIFLQPHIFNVDRKDEQDEVQKLRGEREMQTCARRPDTSVAPCAVLCSCGRLTPRRRGGGREGLFTVNAVNEDSERDPATLV